MMNTLSRHVASVVLMSMGNVTDSLLDMSQASGEDGTTKRSREIRQFRHPIEVHSLVFSSNGQALAVGTGDEKTGGIHLWDTKTGKSKWQLATERRVLAMAISSDSKWLFSGGDGKTVTMRNIKSKEVIARFQVNDSVCEIVSSPTADLIAVALDNGDVVVWDFAKKRRVLKLSSADGSPDSLSFAPDGKTLAAAGAGIKHSYVLWRIRDGLVLRRGPRGHRFGAFAVRFLQDGRSIATASYQGTIKLWDAVAGKELRILQKRENLISAIAVFPARRLIAVGDWAGNVRLRDMDRPKLTQRLVGKGGLVTCIEFSENGKLIAIAQQYHQVVKIWRVDGMKVK